MKNAGKYGLRKQVFLIALLALLVTLIQAQEHARTTDPTELQALLDDAVKNGKGALIFLSDYTHVQIITRRSADKKGNVKEVSETWEAYLPALQGRPKPVRWVRIKLKKNGVLLPPDKIEKERIKAGERLAQAEREANTDAVVDEESLPDAKGAYFTMTVRRPLRKALQFDVKTILRHCEFASARREMLARRATIALEFRPQPEARLPEAEAFVSQLTGTVWIDEADKILVRAEGWSLNAPTRAGKPAIYYESIRVSGDKWLPHKIVLNGLHYKELFKGLDEEIEVALEQYQRFQTESKEVKLDASKARPKP